MLVPEIGIIIIIIIITYLLTYCMEKSPSWEANRLQLVKKFSAFYWNQRFITAFIIIIIIIIITCRDYSKIYPASWSYFPSCPIQYDFRNRKSGVE